MFVFDLWYLHSYIVKWINIIGNTCSETYYRGWEIANWFSSSASVTIFRKYIITWSSVTEIWLTDFQDGIHLRVILSVFNSPRGRDGNMSEKAGASLSGRVKWIATPTIHRTKIMSSVEFASRVHYTLNTVIHYFIDIFIVF